LPIANPGFADPSPVLPVRYAWQLDSRQPVPDFLTRQSSAKKTTRDVIYFTEVPGGPP
jgi:hypothetical protein